MKILRPSFKMKSLETVLSNKINSIDLSNKKSNYNLLLDLFNHGVASVQPKNILDKFLFVNNKEITIKENHKKKTYKEVKDIFVICIGKASVDMALTAKSISKSWSMPLLRLDVGRLFSSLVGSS